MTLEMCKHQPQRLGHVQQNPLSPQTYPLQQHGLSWMPYSLLPTSICTLASYQLCQSVWGLQGCGPALDALQGKQGQLKDILAEQLSAEQALTGLEAQTAARVRPPARP